MKKYDVTITEKLKKTVTVEADSRLEAEMKVSDDWRSGKYVLDAECFDEAEFSAKQHSRDRER